MADFVTNLWESVFTPGPTPTLLIATNATFAFLQLTLGVLLAATYSIHFVILSLLCAGLWWSINWFAEEVRQAQEKEEEAKRIRQRQEKDRQGKDGESADDEGGETETEQDAARSAHSTLSTQHQTLSPQDQAVKESIIEDIQKQAQATQASQATGLEAPSEPTLRKATSDTSADTSTDSEWEKVDSER
ncbi:ER protein Pkr1-domain-containing protein [Delphinella strobiligena]|nr:ER protein Pkr1-domain-containing protein [Delphinella strobiligena]